MLFSEIMNIGIFCLHILLSIFRVFQAELCENFDHVIIVSSNQSYYKNQSLYPDITSALQNISNQTCILLMEDQSLSDYHSLVNIDRLSIIGAKIGDRTSITCLKEESGFYFSQSKSIYFKNLNLYWCGRNTAEMVKTAFLFANVQNVCFSNVVISDSVGFAVILLNISGDVLFHQVTVQNNSLARYSDTNLYLGGGIFISQQNFEINASINITNCVISSNLNTRDYTQLNEHVQYSFGAGLVVIFGQTSTSNTLIVNNTSFYNNKGLFGGGLLLKFSNDSCDNKVFVLNSSFIKNKAKLHGGGINTYSDTKYKNLIKFLKCNFTNNAAKLGGALSHYNEKFSNNMIILKACQIFFNYGELGAGIYAEKVSVTISSVVISNNFLSWENPLAIGQGAVFAFFSKIEFHGESVVSSNSITSITLDMSTVVVFGSLLITNNSGVYGGACALYQHSALDIRNGSKVTFSNNRAYRGGAIFVQTTGPFYISDSIDNLHGYKCFMNVFVKESIVSYVNNTSEMGGENDIFASTIKGCMTSSQFKTPYENKLVQMFGTQSIVTNPINIVLIETEWSEKFPGEWFSPTVRLVDEINQNVSDIIEITLNKNFFFAGLNSNISIKINGSRNSVYKISVKSENVFKEVSDNLTYCPFAYSFSSDTCICNKKDNLVKGLVCNLNGTVSLSRGLYTDIGQDGVKNDNEATETCPVDYCLECNNVACLLNTSLNNSLCASSRTGYLCSRCIENTTLQFGSNDCKPCTESTQEISVGLAVLFFVPFFTVCLCVIFFNVCIYENWLNSSIYFYQVLKFVIGDTLNESPNLKNIVDILSLDLLNAKWQVLNFCFKKNWNNLDKLAVEYIIPVTMFMTLFVITLLHKLFVDINNLVPKAFGQEKRHLLQLLPLILILTYADVTRITFNLLQPVDYSGDFTDLRPYWYAAISYGKYPDHSFYIVLALLFFLIIIICPIIFVVPKLRPNWLKSTPGLVDGFCGKFNDNVVHQGFALFYFFARIVIISFGTFLTSRNNQCTAVTLSSIFLFVVFASSSPFQNWTINYFDCFILFLHVILGILRIGKLGLLPGLKKEILGDVIVWISFLPAVMVFIRCWLCFIYWISKLPYEV